jgi:hypothetical protein
MVSWDSCGLEIEASNSSLNQILYQVAADAGAKLEGLRISVSSGAMTQAWRATCSGSSSMAAAATYSWLAVVALTHRLGSFERQITCWHTDGPEQLEPQRLER